MQLQFKDRVCLNRSERPLGIQLGSAAGGVDINLFAGEVSDEIVACFTTIRAAADDDNHVVHVIKRDVVDFQNVLAHLGIQQQVGSPAANHVPAVINKLLDRLD